MEAYSAVEDEDIHINEPPEYDLGQHPESSGDDLLIPGFHPKYYQEGRPIFSKHQVLYLWQLRRGSLILAHDVYTGDSLFIVLHGPVKDGHTRLIRAKNLISGEVEILYLSDYSVCAYQGGLWATHRYLVDTGKNL